MKRLQTPDEIVRGLLNSEILHLETRMEEYSSYTKLDEIGQDEVYKLHVMKNLLQDYS